MEIIDRSALLFQAIYLLFSTSKNDGYLLFDSFKMLSINYKSIHDKNSKILCIYIKSLLQSAIFLFEN